MDPFPSVAKDVPRFAAKRLYNIAQKPSEKYLSSCPNKEEFAHCMPLAHRALFLWENDSVEDLGIPRRSGMGDAARLARTMGSVR